MLMMSLMTICIYSVIQVFGCREVGMQHLSFKMFVGSGTLLVMLIILGVFTELVLNY